jgi:cobalt-zinc-cadmium efflux system outer membrane protein
MYRLRKALLIAPLLASGCLYGARERTDDAVAELAARPFDRTPDERPRIMPPAKDEAQNQASAASAKGGIVPVAATDIQTAGLLQPLPKAVDPASQDIRERVKIPPVIPGGESAEPLRKLPEVEAEKQRYIRTKYPPLPELPTEPKALPGPDGKPYRLSDLQQIAAAHSPTLRQAASDVEAARGNLITAGAYPNPTVALQVQPSNDGSTASVWGFSIDQPIKTFGKLTLARAAAQKALDNAELALKKARSDLSTQVRNTYFGLLVAKETVRVTKAVAVLTDNVYLWQVKLLEEARQSTAYDPSTLRAQAYLARLAYQQAIQSYDYAWKELVAAIGQRQLPLTEVAGRLDVHIPYYDYDTVLAHALRNHTDVLAARNTLEQARYNLKAAQIAPWPDVDVNFSVLKEFALAPEKYVHTASVGVPIPLWDKNRGNILAAEAALVRATEEPHRVELNLTTNLATAYTAYKTNLEALEQYRRHILPDQVFSYRGIKARRDLDPGVGFLDLVTAQQTLSASVTQYLTVLGQVWSSVVSVADFLQTDDLFQLAEPREMAPVPDLDQIEPWPCCHRPGDHGDHGPAGCVALPPGKAPSGPALPAPTTTAPTAATRPALLPPATTAVAPAPVPPPQAAADYPSPPRALTPELQPPAPPKPVATDSQPTEPAFLLEPPPPIHGRRN